MTFDPTTNRIPMGLLTEEEKEILKAAKHGWRCYNEHYGEWDDDDNPLWIHYYIYRAKPEPVVKSVWANVYFGPDELDNYSIRLSPAFYFRKTVDHIAGEARIGVARFDLIDGVLSVELEPLDGEPEYNDDVTTEVVQQINKERGVDVSNGTWRKIDG